jgi:preprotein translocase subunit SecF
VIGFLTILGYSLYDTVVVFDKVRENTKSVAAVGKMTYSQAANLAVNQTIVRSANTSLIALLPVGSILFVGAGLLGAGTLKDLSLALFIGLAVGTYSSIFIAPPFLASLREKEPAMQALAKRVASRGGISVEAVSSAVTGRPAISPSGIRGPRNQPKRKGRK